MPQKQTIDKAAPKTPTGAAAYLQRVEGGELWTAPSGTTIRVRDLSIGDRATILSLPAHLQKVVEDIIERSDALRTEKSDEDDSVDAVVSRGLDLFGGKIGVALERKYELGVALCMAGWTAYVDDDGVEHPIQVVPSPEDVTDPATHVPAPRIPVKDRDGWLAHVFGGDEEAAQTLTSFRQQPDSRVATG